MHISEPLNEFSQTEHPPHNQHPDQETVLPALQKALLLRPVTNPLPEG